MRRRKGLRFGRHRQNKRLRINFTLKGREGRPFRIALYVIAAVVLVILLGRFFRPKVQLMNTAEMQRITDRGVLIVCVRDDTPRFAYDGEGLEIELARLFADYLLPETETDAAAKLVIVSSQTASTKLSDGTIDVAIALMQKGASSQYSYSYSYYTDTCIVAVRSGDEDVPLDSITIGYVQNTAGANVLSSYIDSHETKVERTLIDRLRGTTPELPAGAVTFTKQAFASYPDMLKALETGRIGGAVLTGVYAARYENEYSFSKHRIELGKVDYAITSTSDEPAIAQLADVFIYDLKESGKLDELLKKYGLQ